MRNLTKMPQLRKSSKIEAFFDTRVYTFLLIRGAREQPHRSGWCYY